VAGVVEGAEVVTEMHGHLDLGPPKTSAGRRRVGLPGVVVEALQEHLAGRSVEPDGLPWTAMGICSRRRTERCGTVWTAFTRRRAMPSRPRRGPDLDQDTE